MAGKTGKRINWHISQDLGDLALYDAFFRHLAIEQATIRDAVQTDAKIAQAILQSLHKEQAALVEDPYKRKAALCPRRSGKSWAAMAYAHIVCLTRPGSKAVIINLTFGTGKNVYWWAMQEFARHYGLKLDYFVNELRVDFPNGSKIMLIGGSSKAQIDKLRGGKYDLVVIDECKSFPAVILDELIADVIEPALMDRRGTLMLIGTPGSTFGGLFYQATFPGLTDDNGIPFSKSYLRPEPYWSRTNDLPRWSRHSWTQLDNKALPHLVEEANDKKRLNGWDDDHPTWLREYLGQWVAADSAFVYVYAKLIRENPELVTWKPQHKGLFGLDPEKKWHFLLGLDLGFEDDTAAVIGAYNEDEPILYHVWDSKSPHMDVDQVGKLIQMCMEMVPQGFDAIVGDFGGGGKQIITTFIRRYGINIIPAEKRDKFDYIELMNADYLTGRIRLRKDFELPMEKMMLTWDLSKGGKEHLAHTGKLKEHPEMPNHLCDAWLYIWRFSYHFFAKRVSDGPEPGTIEWEKQEMERAMEQLMASRRIPSDEFEKYLGPNEDVAKAYDIYCRIG